MFADTLVKQAYDNWMRVVEYDGKALLNFKQNKKSVTTRNDTRLASSSYTAQYDQQSTEHSASIPVPVEQPSIDRVAGGGNEPFNLDPLGAVLVNKHWFTACIIFYCI